MSRLEVTPPDESVAATDWRGAGLLLRLRAFRLLVSGQMLGQAADGLAQITFAQVVLFEAGQGATPWEITKLLAVTLLPYTLVGPFAGVVIDRYDRRRVMVWVSAFRAALVVASLAVLALDSQPLAYLAVLLLLSSSRFVLAAKGAALPNTVSRPDLVMANSISSIGGMTAAFLGAVIGSAFVAVVPAAGFVIGAAGYAGAALTFRRLPGVGGGEATEQLAAGIRRATAELIEGVHFAVGKVAVRRPLLAVAANRMLLGAGFILLVLIADERYDLEAPSYGLALAVTGLGAFLGTWSAPAVARHFHRLPVLPLSFLVGAAAAAIAAWAPNLAVLIAGLGAAAFAFQVLKVLVDSLLQEASPDEVRGRVFSVYDMLYNLAFILAGLALVPLWDPGREETLLWLLSVAFVGVGALLARAQRTWPFDARTRPAGEVRHRWWKRLAALPLGAVPASAFPAMDLWLLAIVGLVPLIVFVCVAPNRREAGWRAWFGGTGFFVAMHHWLIPNVGPFAVPIALALGLLWIPWGLIAFALLGRGRANPRRLAAATLLVPSAWVVTEYVRSWEHLGGPWALLGTASWQNQRLLAVVSVGGVWLLSFVLVGVNVGLAGASLPRVSGRTRLTGALVAAVLLGATLAFGALRASPEVVGTVSVAGVQPGVVHRGEDRFAAHEDLTRTLVGEDLDLVVWAESSVGFDLDDDPQYAERLASLAEDVGAPILVNVDARRGEGGIFKSSVLVQPTGVADRYDKMRLVPFGEYIPVRGLMGWTASLTEAADEDRRRGDDLVIMDVDGVGIGPLVCFESAFPDLSRHLAHRGADLIVLQTATTTFQGSWAQAQHAALGAVRAVESGRPVVHSAVSGVSAVFDAEGRQLTRLGNHDTGVWRAEAPITDVETLYVRFGDWVPVAAVLLLLAGALVAGSRAARRTAASSQA